MSKLSSFQNIISFFHVPNTDWIDFYEYLGSKLAMYPNNKCLILAMAKFSFRQSKQAIFFIYDTILKEVIILTYI